MTTDFVILRFKGEDGFGYNKGQVYGLLIERYKGLEKFWRGHGLPIRKLNGSNQRSYSNSKALFIDWEIPSGDYAVTINEMRRKVSGGIN